MSLSVRRQVIFVCLSKFRLVNSLDKPELVQEKVKSNACNVKHKAIFHSFATVKLFTVVFLSKFCVELWNLDFVSIWPKNRYIYISIFTAIIDCILFENSTPNSH